jgi:hypothetical protein
VPAPELVLQYFEVLAWPFVTATALIVFRDPLSGLVDRVRSVSAFGASAELAAEERREKADLQAALTEGAAVLGAAEGNEADVAVNEVPATPGQGAQPSVTDDRVPGARSPDSDDDGQSESGLDRLREEVEERRSKQAETRRRRHAIEAIIREAAEWGHARGVAGVDVSGTHIMWDGDVPRLKAPSVLTAQAQALRSRSPREMTRRAEQAMLDEVARNPYAVNLERRAADLSERVARARVTVAIDPAYVKGLENELEEVRGKLRAVNPFSAYI